AMKTIAKVAATAARSILIRHLLCWRNPAVIFHPSSLRRNHHARSAPESEARGGEVLIEGEDVATAGRLHDGEAHRIRIRHGSWAESFQPASRGGVVSGCRELNRHARALVDQLQKASRRLYTRAQQRQAMGLGDDQTGGEQRDATRERGAKQPVRLGMILVALAAERDPGAAIDEQAWRSGGGWCDRGPASRQR